MDLIRKPWNYRYIATSTSGERIVVEARTRTAARKEIIAVWRKYFPDTKRENWRVLEVPIE